MPIAQVYDRYKKQLDNLAATSSGIADAIVLSGQRPWMVPDQGDGTNLWNYDIFNISGSTSIINAFDREQINIDYTKALKTAGEENGGLLADTKATKLQNDYLACQERSLSLRYASSIRSAMHASARRKGHGNSVGVFGVMNKVVENIISAGYQS